MKVSTKLVLGFGIVLVLTIGIAIASYVGLSQSTSGFNQYRDLARLSNELGRVQANLLKSELSVEKFLEYGTQNYVDEYEQDKKLMNELIAEAKKLNISDEHQQVLNDIQSSFNDYDKVFRTIIEGHKKRDKLVYETLDPNGEQMRKTVESIMESAFEDDDIIAAFYAGGLQEHVLLGRLHITKYLDTNDLEDFKTAKLNLEGEEAKEHLDILDVELQNTKRRQLLNDFKEYRNTYLQAIDELSETIVSRNDLIENSLNKIGEEIADEIEETKLTVKDSQDVLGPTLKSRNEFLILLIIIIAIIAILIAIFIVIFITISILNTLGGEPRFLANVAKDISDGILDTTWVENTKGKKRGLLSSMAGMVESLKTKSKLIEEISEGNLDVRFELASEQDEIGKSLRSMISSLKQKSGFIEKIADGDFTVRVKLASQKDVVGHSLIKMIRALNEIFRQINATVEEVRSGSDQLSNSSQDLSEGASDQAASLEEISSSLQEVSIQVQQNTENVVKSSELAKTVKGNADKGNEQMSKLVKAMNQINNSAGEIKRIVKVIDDIAFQTNLLALNANIEAARVGKYGKGFAVVANSVRSLATESAESVKETTGLVDDAIQNIEIGTTLVNETAVQFKEIFEKAIEVDELVSEVANASQEQSRAVEQITTALNQVEHIVQNNTANAEQNASTSEELAGQANNLRDMIREFKYLSDGDDVNENKYIANDYEDYKNLPPEQLQQLIKQIEDRKEHNIKTDVVPVEDDDED
jgi:methyl-accepting chemotaxis protein